MNPVVGDDQHTAAVDDALYCIREAMTKVETTKESWFEAEIKRMAGEIALIVARTRTRQKAEAYFERALAVAREQQAKSWELRAAMSMARLWRDQGKRDAGPRTSRTRSTAGSPKASTRWT